MDISHDIPGKSYLHYSWFHSIAECMSIYTTPPCCYMCRRWGTERMLCIRRYLKIRMKMESLVRIYMRLHRSCKYATNSFCVVFTNLDRNYTDRITTPTHHMEGGLIIIHILMVDYIHKKNREPYLHHNLSHSIVEYTYIHTILPCCCTYHHLNTDWKLCIRRHLKYQILIFLWK